LEYVALTDGDGNFTLTFRFAWQASQDRHLFDVTFENWQPVQSGMDG
jgi:hypothetical protein